MGSLFNTLSRLIDNGERQALSIIDEAQRAFNEFDFGATVKSLRDGFNDFAKNVKETISDLKVFVPFDEKTEEYTCDIKDGVITVKVTGKHRELEVTSTIPANCKVDEMKTFYDKKHKQLVFSIPKDITKDENVKKLKEAATQTLNGSAEWLKKALKEKAENVAASTTAPTSKPKARKKPIPKTAGYARGKDGKFVSTKKKNG